MRKTEGVITIRLTHRKMKHTVIEANYPITFRQKDAEKLGQQLKNRHSVVLIGMKRVGISNFLRFFHNHKDIVKTYIRDGNNHLFVPVDLNDLVERELFPFWALTLKRIVDTVERSVLANEVKKNIEALFLDSIQSKDLFLLIDNVRRSLIKIVEHNMLPTIFLLRFDRMKDVATPEFFANLQGLKDATHHKLSYVFTSFRSLDSLSPSVFTKSSLSMFSHDMYMKPATREDTKIVYATYKKRYKLQLTRSAEEGLFTIVDGYIQYLQLALIALHEKHAAVKTKDELYSYLLGDERTSLQSEELWESLNPEEQEILLKVIHGQKIHDGENERGRYLIDTGLLIEGNGKQIFSPLFLSYVDKKKEDREDPTSSVEFSKKEYALFTFLKEHEDEVCERERIIEAVWPQEQTLGVSDWAIDRLVARVRNKLKLQKAHYEIQTVKTRGYKLIAD